MTKFYLRWTVGTLACLALVCSMLVIMPIVQTAEAQETKVFTILHTNDEHSEIIPYGPAIDYPTYPTVGGFSRIAHEIGRIKTEKAAAGEPVLTLSAGDISQGTLFGWLESQPNGHAELSLLQAMGYDAVAIGNHDFDMGSGYRAQVYGQAKADGIKLPILCANIQFDATNPQAAALQALYSATDLGGTQLAIQPYTIKTLSNGLKVGIFGIMGVAAEAVAPAAAATGVTFGNVSGDPEDQVSFFNRVIVAQNMVDTLRAAGCDVVIGLSHSGTYEETNLATLVHGIDVIVGGHTHELTYPPVIAGVSDTIIVQAGAYTRYLGELELEYAGGKVSVRNAQAIPIDENIPTDPTIDAAIQAYIGALNVFLNPVIGMNILDVLAETDIAGDGGFNLNDAPPFVETNLGDMVTDAYGTIASILDPVNMVDIAIEANGVIRAGIPKGGTGQFSFYDLYRTIPLGVDLSGVEPVPLGYPEVAFYLFGGEILGALEGTLDIAGGGENDFFLQIAGAQFYYRPAGPEGGKIVTFEVDDGAGGWQPINPTGLYKVATDYYSASFLASFGLTPRDITGTPTTVANSIVYQGPNQLKCWQALLGYVGLFPDIDGDGVPNVPPSYAMTEGRITAAGWYLAEGSTDGGMEDFVLVQNPTDAEVHVNVKFQTDTGEVAPDELQGIGIPADSRVTFKANDWVTNFNVSTLVEPIDGEVICERAMYGDNRTWAHDSIGVTAPAGPAPEWFLAEGSTDGGMETWLLVQNPYKSAVHVDIVFQTDTGPVAPPDLQGVEIPAESRRTFPVNNYVTNYNVSTYVEAQDGLVVCERAMYGDNRTWAHDSIGTSVISDEWYMAEGSTLGGMETFVLIQNPGDTDVHVDITFNTDVGDIAPVALQGTTIPANSRRTFKVNDWVATYEASTYVKCTDGFVVCERAMYGNDRTWAHDSIGAPAPLDTWYLAEGSTGGGMETFVLIQNPGATDAQVNVVFQTDTGEVAIPALQGLNIPAGSRETVFVNDWVPDNFNVSTMVEATTGTVIVERAMYGNGRTWAHDSIGYAPM
ncbi:MAG: bifunctional metallophosphatase/5'-nucleotidase [Actinobacteria bacterium]|nr:bifunctional metallophosphatase/5'-nucleotidase [Actinomycetota bacterium]